MVFRTFSHGIHPPEAKHTATLPIQRFPFPPNLVMLLAPNIGKASRPIVREGQEVLRGQKIAEVQGMMSVPVHAPATGIVTRIGESLNMDGVMAPAIILQPYPGSDQSIQVETPVDVDSLTPAQIIQGIQEIGMVGLGGAAFHTHVKYSPPSGKKVHTLVLNGCECEPYMTADHRVMLEQAQDVVTGSRLIAKATGVEKIVIAVESNKMDAVETLKKAIGNDPRFSVETLQTKYPQGAEKMITRALFGMDIPTRGLPADIGLIISNVTTVAEIGRLLPKGRGVIERVITLAGEGIDRPGNYIIPIGTPLNFMLDEVGFNDKARQVVLGGPMMGKGVAFLETPVTKGITGIIVLSEREMRQLGHHVQPCIQCGECVRACPIHLNPSKLGRLAQKERYEDMAAEFNLGDCFECGSCSYVCPSHIPLVHLFRVAKKVNRARSN
ncbi:MAG: electron transport complex subunit RsxC [SAR324 cluster bacterium]|nr:electron transport complex subunit RsxC [SAR324 cluster bacterium]